MIEHNLTTNRVILTLFVVSLIIVNCSLLAKKRISDFNSVQINSEIQLVKSDDGELVSLKDSFSIFYYKDLVLYEFPTVTTTSKVTFSKNGDSVINDELLGNDYGNNYFVFKPSSKYGFFYDSLNSSTYKKLNVDSLLTARTFAHRSFFNGSKDSLVDTKYLAGILQEKYVTKNIIDATYYDSTYLTYSDSLKDVEYSFSRELDSFRKKKLVSVTWVYKQGPARNSNLIIPRREFCFKMAKKEIAEKEEIIAFIENIAEKIFK